MSADRSVVLTAWLAFAARIVLALAIAVALDFPGPAVALHPIPGQTLAATAVVQAGDFGTALTPSLRTGAGHQPASSLVITHAVEKCGTRQHSGIVRGVSVVWGTACPFSRAALLTRLHAI